MLSSLFFLLSIRSKFENVIFKGGTNNEHWRPTNKLCSLCSKPVDFDIIIKFENLEQEERYSFFVATIKIKTHY